MNLVQVDYRSRNDKPPCHRNAHQEQACQADKEQPDGADFISDELKSPKHSPEDCITEEKKYTEVEHRPVPRKGIPSKIHFSLLFT